MQVFGEVEVLGEPAAVGAEAAELVERGALHQVAHAREAREAETVEAEVVPRDRRAEVHLLHGRREARPVRREWHLVHERHVCALAAAHQIPKDLVAH